MSSFTNESRQFIETESMNPSLTIPALNPGLDKRPSRRESVVQIHRQSPETIHSHRPNDRYLGQGVVPGEPLSRTREEGKVGGSGGVLREGRRTGGM